MANSPFGDTTLTKVFVGGLAWETQSEMLRKHFEQFGEILEAVVITDKNTRRSKGYGFVTFHDAESASRACADPRPIIDGRRANCNLASLGRPRPPPSPARLGAVGPFIGGFSLSHGPYASSSIHQPQFPYFINQQGFPFSYGYTGFGPDFASYPQFVQVYGFPAPVPSMSYPLGQPVQTGQLGQPLLGGPGYMGFQGNQVQSHPMLPFAPPNISPSGSGVISPVQRSLSPGAAPFSHPAVHPRPLVQDKNGSDQAV